MPTSVRAFLHIVTAILIVSGMDRIIICFFVNFHRVFLRDSNVFAARKIMILR
jgi:hypothetical protein